MANTNETRHDVTGDKVNTSIMTIENNVLLYNRSVIQLSNIEQVDIAPIPDTPIPNWVYLFGIAGIILLAIQPLLGLIALIAAAIGYLWIQSKNSDKGEYLTIILTSGRKLYFFSKNSSLLKQIVKIITNSMNGNTAKQIINFNHSSINGSIIGCDTVNSNYK